MPKAILLLFVASILPLAQGVTARAFDVHEKQLITWIGQNMAQVHDDLKTLVNINSGTMNHQGVRDVGAWLAQSLSALGFQTDWVTMPPEMNRAGHLVAKRTGNKGKRILMIGHLDTVFEKDSPFQTYTVTGSIARGPGVADMKSGDLIILYALKALASAGALEGAQITVVFTGDEEQTGRPLDVSRHALIEAAKSSDLALAYEGGVKNLEKVAAARRGFTGWTLKVTGKQGHSSQIFTQNAGMGSIFRTTQILDQFRRTLSGEKFLTFNPGLIIGGTEITFDKEHSQGTAFGKSNVISKETVVLGDLRCVSLEQREKSKTEMKKIVEQKIDHTHAELMFDDSYPPMAPTVANLKLVKMLSDVSLDLGQGKVTAQDPSERGAADASFVAPYTAVIDGLGAEGYREHSTDEYLNLQSLEPAIQRSAILIYRLIHKI